MLSFVKNEHMYNARKELQLELRSEQGQLPQAFSHRPRFSEGFVVGARLTLVQEVSDFP